MNFEGVSANKESLLAGRNEKLFSTKPAIVSVARTSYHVCISSAGSQANADHTARFISQGEHPLKENYSR